VIKFIIAMGIGFSPGSVKYIPTLGFVSSTSTSPIGFSERLLLPRYTEQLLRPRYAERLLPPKHTED
jgi:hypothetical protein